MRKNYLIWMAFIALLFLLSVLIFWGVNALKIPAPWSVVVRVVDLLLLLYFLAKAVYRGWNIVPENWNYIIEVFGAYIGRPLEPGWYILFPWGEFVVIRKAVFRGVQLMSLYLDEQKKDQRGGGNVEFEDCSSSLSTFFYFQIIDPELSTYKTNDLFRAIEEKVDNSLRAFLGLYKLEEVIKMKSNFCLEAIAALTDFCPEPPLSKDDLIKLRQEAQTTWEDSSLYISLMSWGVKPVDLVISDIKLTEELENFRKVILVAEKELETAVIGQKTATAKKVSTITDAEAKKAADILNAEGAQKVAILGYEGEKQGKILVGEGIAAQINEIIKAGVAKTKIAAFLVQNKKWEAISKGNNAVTLIEDSNNSGISSLGANFGAGFNSVNNKKTRKDDNGN